MPIRVIISEGDRLLNKSLAQIIESDNNLKLLGQAHTGLESISLTIRNRPQVLVLSTNLPDLDTKSIINRLMKQYPTPILILFPSEDAEKIKEIRKMDIGIINYLEMKNVRGKRSISDIALTTRIHILAKLKVEKFSTQIRQGIKIAQNRQDTSHRYLTRSSSRSNQSTGTIVNQFKYSGRGRSSKLIIIGTSTGGPRLLSEIVPKFPNNLPPIVIVQHMPVGFITAFSKRLNRLSRAKVKEASSGDKIMSGRVYLAPGGKHLEFHRVARGVPKILLTDGEPVNFVKPAVDVTLESAATTYRDGVISVILTGMGSDGREGSRIVKQEGGIVIALNQQDSDIYGMNRSVIEAGLADRIVGKNELVHTIIKAIEGKL